MSKKTDTQHIEFLTFRLNEQEFSLDIMCVREIRGWTKTTPLPFAPKSMKGVINLRGTVLPVMDLAERLEMPSKSFSERNVIIVVSHEDKMTGLMVDSVSDIITIPESEMHPPPNTSETTNPNLIKALTMYEDRMIRVLDLYEVISLQKSEAA